MNGARMCKTNANVCTYVDNEIFIGIHTNQKVSAHKQQRAFNERA